MIDFLKRAGISTACIWAQDWAHGLIGIDGEIPWRSKADLKFYAANTKGAVVIIGRKTFESLPPVAFLGRVTIVVTSSSLSVVPVKEVHTASSLDDAVLKALSLINEETPPITKKEIFFAGGLSIYEEAINNEMAERLLITTVRCDIESPDDREDVVYAPEAFRHLYDLEDRYSYSMDESEPSLDFESYGLKRPEKMCNERIEFDRTVKFYTALSKAGLL